MKIYKVGEKSKAVCPSCKSVQDTTFQEKIVSLKSGTQIKDVLVALCDICEAIVATPQQSTPRIREIVHQERKSIEARVPRHLSDVWINSYDQLGLSDVDSPMLFRFYLNRLSTRAALLEKATQAAKSEEAEGKATARFSVKVSENCFDRFELLVKRTRLDKSSLIRGILVEMAKDVLANPAGKTRKEIEEVFSQLR